MTNHHTFLHPLESIDHLDLLKLTCTYVSTANTQKEEQE